MATLDIRITSMYPPGSQGGTRAYASATIDGCFAVRGIKVVEGGKDGLFVSMPSRKNQDGYKEVCFPVTAEFREQLYSGVLNAYHQHSPWRRLRPHPSRQPRSRKHRPADGRNVTENIRVSR